MCLEFFTPVTCISRKRNGIRQKKQCPCSKRLFYYLTLNKTRDVFHNLGPLISLRLKNTGRAALISVDLLKITLLHILFTYGQLLCISMGLHTGGLYSRGGLHSEFYGTYVSKSHKNKQNNIKKSYEVHLSN